MCTAGRIDVDLAHTERTLLGGGGFFYRLLAEIHQFVDALDEHENDDSHNQEVDNGGSKVAEINRTDIRPDPIR